MTDLLHVISDFPSQHYTHLLPSLERNLISTTDLLTFDALDLAKRAQLPLLDVRRLKEHVLATLQGQLGLESELHSKFQATGKDNARFGILRSDGPRIAQPKVVISTLDASIDEALGGGIPAGYMTEITGESGAGKTQLLLTLLLSCQMDSPQGLARPTCYISTEHPLPTSRLQQMLTSHPRLSNLQATSTVHVPSLSRILTLQTPDLESQEHILAFQLPIVLQRHNVGLVVLDSIAANYRAESSTTASSAAILATRSTQLVRLGALLRNLAREYDCAIVVANQVADRFDRPLTHTSTVARLSAVTGPDTPCSSSPASTAGNHPPAVALNALSLDHQQCFFTGWGDDPSRQHQHDLKTPSLGLVWANQIAARIALVKEQGYDSGRMSTRVEGASEGAETAEWTPRRWRRWIRIAFASWVKTTEEQAKGVEIEIWAGGVRATGERKREENHSESSEKTLS